MSSRIAVEIESWKNLRDSEFKLFTIPEMKSESGNYTVSSTFDTAEASLLLASDKPFSPGSHFTSSIFLSYLFGTFSVLAQPLKIPQGQILGLCFTTDLNKSCEDKKWCTSAN